MGCDSRLLAAQALIPELPVLGKEGPTGSTFVERVGLIDCARKPKCPARLGPTREWHSLRCKLCLRNKLRITGGFGPSPASVAAAVEVAEKCQALVAAGDQACRIPRCKLWQRNYLRLS